MTRVVVLGTGAAGLVAAVAAADAGAEVVLVEKGDAVGGTTALSGGTTWLPAVGGGREEALLYLMSLSHGLIDPALAAAFVDTGPELLAWLRARTPLRYHLVDGLPDYHPEHVGGRPGGGRSLDPDLFRCADLGPWADRIVAPERIPRLMLTETALGGGRSPDREERARRVAEDWRGCGHALVGALLAALLDRGVEPRTGARATGLVLRDGAVIGVRVGDEEVRADAVVIATGGFEWDPELVAAHLRGPMTSPASVATNTGDGLRMAMSAGAALGTMREAWWVPTVEVPGAARPCLVLAERTRPGSIMVNRTGARFANEAANYNALGGALHQFDPTSFRYANLPCWLVVDQAHLDRYGASFPFPTSADTVDELGAAIGVPGLAATVARFNDDAAAGVDQDFGRGASAYDRWNGDLSRPGAAATLGPLTTPPFHAVEVHSGCLGTKGGPRTTVDAQVLHVDGAPIPGLYAAGNAMAGVTGMVYGGAGGTLGPAMVFGYRAGRHAARQHQPRHERHVHAVTHHGSAVHVTDAATLGALLWRAAAAGSGGVVTPAGRASWGGVLQAASALAVRMAASGIGHGSRVALFADNSVEGVDLLFACALLGAVAVPVNTRLSPAEVRYVLADAAPDLVAVTGDPELAALVRAAGHDPVRVAELDPAGPFVGPAVAPDDVALIVYTSGTTAHPRGCALTHRTLVEAGQEVGRDRFRVGSDDVLWDVLPIFHLSFVNPLLAILDAGGTFVTDRRFDAGRALAQIRDTGVTVAFTCFPTVMDALLDHPDFDACFARVRLMLNVGPPDTLRAIAARAPGTVQLTSYGSSEMAGIVATTAPDDPDDVRLGTNGRPLPGTELAAVDPDTGALLPDGALGEIVARGAGMFTGYTGGPLHDRTSWFRSGDLGLVDAEGRVHYRGRLKDMIKVGGENVAALEVEAVLARHPDVAVAAVVAAPDRRYTEVPAAFVQLRPGATVTAAELQEHCAAALAPFKVPRHVRFVTEWPMSATKIQKGPLREQIVHELRERV